MPDPLKRSVPAKPPKVAVPAAKSRIAPKGAVPEVHAKADGYIPFRDRFRAWWDGVEPEAVVRAGQKARTPKTQRLIELDDTSDREPQANLGAARIRICDQVWGDGFDGPGKADYAVEMARPFSSRNDASVLDLSAGLGGRVAAIARDSFITVTGMERDEEYAEHAAERTEGAGQRNLRSITHYNADRLNLNGLRYDCIIAREEFFTVSDKAELLTTLRDGLRKNGTLAFTDFVLAEPDQNEGDVMDQWYGTEPALPQPWSFDVYRQQLEELNFNVVIFEDDSLYYRDLVLQAWKEFVDSLEHVTFDRTLVDALMQEAELWLHRVRTIESGQIGVLRVLARAKSGPV